jgi:Rps23 Pro-64 3,4-dihydroxylase Tpa1-like proline 4-hydroxylase
MNIIFGDSITTISENYTTLELDTFRKAGNTDTITAYCVVEKPALHEFANMESYKKIHDDVIKYYKQREWNYCEQAIQGLMGRWGGELDTFYTNLLGRVAAFKESEPPEDWDGILIKD